MTAFSPGQSPPPVRMPIRVIFDDERVGIPATLRLGGSSYVLAGDPEKRRTGAAASGNPLTAPVTMAAVCASPEVHRTALGTVLLTKLPSSSYD